MKWTRVWYVAGALTVAGVLLGPPIAAAGRHAAEDSVGIDGPNDKIEAGQTITVNIDCDQPNVKASLWYSRKGSTDKRGETSVDTDADGKGTGTIDLPGDVATGAYSLSLRCGDTNIVKNDFTVVAASDSSDDKAVTVSPNTVAPGGTITITGYCDKGTEGVKVWYGDADDPGDARAEKSGIEAGDDGEVSQSLVVADSTSPGAYDASLQCGDAKTQTAGFTVSTGGSTAGDGAMAAGDGTTLALIGGGMLAAAALGGAIYLQRRGLGAPV